MLGDLLALHQIVGNLPDNASRYTDDGGHVSLSVALDAQTLVMTISDNGIGLDSIWARRVAACFPLLSARGRLIPV